MLGALTSLKKGAHFYRFVLSADQGQQVVRWWTTMCSTSLVFRWARMAGSRFSKTVRMPRQNFSHHFSDTMLLSNKPWKYMSKWYQRMMVPDLCEWKTNAHLRTRVVIPRRHHGMDQTNFCLLHLWCFNTCKWRKNLRVGIHEFDTLDWS